MPSSRAGPLVARRQHRAAAGQPRLQRRSRRARRRARCAPCGPCPAPAAAGVRGRRRRRRGPTSSLDPDAAGVEQLDHQRVAQPQRRVRRLLLLGGRAAACSSTARACSVPRTPGSVRCARGLASRSPTSSATWPLRRRWAVNDRADAACRAVVDRLSPRVRPWASQLRNAARSRSCDLRPAAPDQVVQQRDDVADVAADGVRGEVALGAQVLLPAGQRLGERRRQRRAQLCGPGGHGRTVRRRGPRVKLPRRDRLRAGSPPGQLRAAGGRTRQPVPVHSTSSASSSAGSTRSTSSTSQPATAASRSGLHPGAHRAGVEHPAGDVGQPVPRARRPLRRVGEVVAEPADRLDHLRRRRHQRRARARASRSSSWQPTHIAEVTGPGTTITCLAEVAGPVGRSPCAPDRAAASTTTVPRVSAGDQPVADQEAVPQRRAARRPLADQQAARRRSGANRRRVRAG